MDSDNYEFLKQNKRCSLQDRNPGEILSHLVDSDRRRVAVNHSRLVDPCEANEPLI
jgi:hypothetical protein